MSLCIIYCMDVRDLMESAGVSIDDSAKLPLPLPDRRLPIHADYARDCARDHRQNDASVTPA